MLRTGEVSTYTEGMMIFRLLSALVAMLVLGGPLCGPAGANLIVPRSEDSPTTVLRGGGRGLTVLGEKLRFTGGQYGCMVRAAYRLRAETAGSWQFSFIWSGTGTVTVGCRGKQQRVDSRPLRKGAKPGSLLERLRQASFALALPAGESVVEVSYRQKWGRSEREALDDFSGWRVARTLRYELWPLSQWRLAPDFGLIVELKVAADAAQAALVRQMTKFDGKFQNLRVLSKKDDGTMGARLEWGRQFPVRLELVLGDRKAIATYGDTPPEDGAAGPESQDPH